MGASARANVSAVRFAVGKASKRLNLAGKAGGANKKRRTGDDSSYARSQPPSTVFSSRFACPSPSPHTHLLFSLFSSNNTSGQRNNSWGYPILARVAIPRLASCHPSISVIIFMPSSSPTSPPRPPRISIFHRPFFYPARPFPPLIQFPR